MNNIKGRIEINNEHKKMNCQFVYIMTETKSGRINDNLWYKCKKRFKKALNGNVEDNAQ